MGFWYIRDVIRFQSWSFTRLTHFIIFYRSLHGRRCSVSGNLREKIWLEVVLLANILSQHGEILIFHGYSKFAVDLLLQLFHHNSPFLIHLFFLPRFSLYLRKRTTEIIELSDCCNQIIKKRFNVFKKWLKSSFTKKLKWYFFTLQKSHILSMS